MPIPTQLASHPPEETPFSFYLRSCPFGHDPSLMTIGEDRNKDWPVDWELLEPLAQHSHNSAVKWAQNHYRCSNSLVNLLLHSQTHEQDAPNLHRDAWKDELKDTWTGSSHRRSHHPHPYHTSGFTRLSLPFDAQHYQTAQPLPSLKCPRHAAIRWYNTNYIRWYNNKTALEPGTLMRILMLDMVFVIDSP